jgi:hypothetical protein
MLLLQWYYSVFAFVLADLFTCVAFSSLNANSTNRCCSLLLLTSPHDSRTVVYMRCYSSHELTIRASQYITYLFSIVEIEHLTKGMFIYFLDVFARNF